MVLQATEGGLFLRSHKPFAFAYLLKEGYWDKLVDTLPQGTLRRVKHQMLILEGLFRASELGDDRSEKGLLEYLKKALNGKTYDDVVALTGRWKLCSLSGPAPAVKVDAKKRQGKGKPGDGGKKGKGKVAVAAAADDEGGEGAGEDADDGGKGQGKGPEVDEDEEEGDVTGIPWSQRHSNLIQKVSARMQTAMLADTLLSHYISWCTTRKEAASGCAFPDGQVLFDHVEEKLCS